MRTLVTVVLLLAAAFAGCSDPPRDDPLPPPPPPPAPPAFAAPVALPQAVGAGEPNIAIHPDGTLFATAPVGAAKPNTNEGAAYLWRSRDGGATWETLRSPDVGPAPADAVPCPPDGLPCLRGGFCSCDADVVASPDGWVYYTDWWIAGFLGPGNYLVEASADGGDTWTATPVTIPQDLAAAMDRQWLVAGPDGFVGLFYSFFAPTPVGGVPVPALGLDRPGQAIHASFSADHGATWSDPVPVVPANGDDAYQIAHPFLAPNGTLMMPYGRVPDADGFWLQPSEVRLAWSTDLGATWRDTLLAEVPHGFDNLWAVQGAVDDATGQATVAWAARTGGVSNQLRVDEASAMGLHVKQFGPLGDRPVQVLRGDGTNFLPWAAARGGATAVGWYGGDATGDVTEAPRDAQWFAYVALAPGGLFDANATVSRVAEEPVKTGPICPKGAACGGDRELLDYVSLVFDADGALHYAFAQSDGTDAFVRVANQSP